MGIACVLDHTAVVVEREFILEPVAKCALVKWHVAFQQLEVQGDVEAVAEGIGHGIVGRDCLIFISGIDANSRVSVTRRINALVLVIFPLRGRLPEIAVTVGHPKTKRSLLLRQGKDSGSWLWTRWPEDTETVAHMPCRDHWDSPIINREYLGSAERPWRHSRMRRKPSRKTLNPSS